MELVTLWSEDLGITSRSLRRNGFAYSFNLHASTYTSNGRPTYPSASPHRTNELKVVQEY